MWRAILRWLGRVSRSVLAAFGPYLATEAAQFVSSVMPIALQAVENAVGLDLDGDGKYEHAREEMLLSLRARSLQYRNRWIRQAIEIAYEQVAQRLEAAQQ